MQTSLQDLRYAGRTLLKNPGFTAVAVLTLGLGIGASTAIYSVVNAVLLNPVPGPSPERLVQIAERNYTQGGFREENRKPFFVSCRSSNEACSKPCANRWKRGG